MLPKIQFSIMMALYLLFQLCVAKNLASNEEVTADITSPDILLEFGLQTPGDYSLKELSYDSLKTSLTLGCITQGYDTPSLNWYFGDDKQKTEDHVSTYASTSTLQLRDLSEKDNDKIFSCKEERDGGAIQSVRLVYKKDEPEVTILANGDIVQNNSRLIVSGSVTLDCIVQGYNPPSIGWFLDGMALLTTKERSTYSTSSSLQIKNIPAYQNGQTFTCRINSQKSWTKSVTLFAPDSSENSNNGNDYLFRFNVWDYRVSANMAAFISTMMIVLLLLFCIILLTIMCCLYRVSSTNNNSYNKLKEQV